MKLYTFSKIEQYIRDKKIQIIDKKTYEARISERTFFSREELNDAIRKGELIFQEDGVYLVTPKGNQKGYLYISYPYITYGNDPTLKFPKFHLTKCPTIEDAIRGVEGKSFSRYSWSNQSKVNLKDKTTNQEYKNNILDLCKNCINSLTKGVNSTELFWKHNKPEEVMIYNPNAPKDIFGYTLDWPEISNKIKKDANGICKKCGIKVSQGLDWRFLHTHHINGDKTDNRPQNLECLCFSCHSEIDERHRLNILQNKNNVILLEQFKKKYK